MAPSYNFADQWCVASYPVTALRIIILLKSLFQEKNRRIPGPKVWNDEQKEALCSNYAKPLVHEKQATRLSALPQINDVDLLIDHFSGLRLEDTFPWIICPLYTVAAVIYFYRQTYFSDVYKTITEGEEVSMNQVRRLVLAIVCNDLKKDGETLPALTGINNGLLRNLRKRLIGKRSLRETRSLLLNAEEYHLHEATGETLTDMCWHFQLHVMSKHVDTKGLSFRMILRERRMEKGTNERDAEEEEEQGIPKEDSGIEVSISPSASPKRARHDDESSEDKEASKRQRLDDDSSQPAQASTPKNNATRSKSPETPAEETTSSSSSESSPSSSPLLFRKARRRLSSSSPSLSPSSSISSSSLVSSSSSSPPLTPWKPQSVALSLSSPPTSQRVTRSKRSSAQKKPEDTVVNETGAIRKSASKVTTGKVEKKTKNKAIERRTLEIATSLGLRPQSPPQTPPPSVVEPAAVDHVESKASELPSSVQTESQELMEDDSSTVTATERENVEEITEKAPVISPSLLDRHESTVMFTTEDDGTEEAEVAGPSDSTLTKTTSALTKPSEVIVESTGEAPLTRSGDSTSLETMSVTIEPVEVVENNQEAEVTEPSYCIETTNVITESAMDVENTTSEPDAAGQSDLIPVKSTTNPVESAAIVESAMEAEETASSEFSPHQNTRVKEKLTIIIKSIEEVQVVRPINFTCLDKSAKVTKPVTAAIIESPKKMQPPEPSDTASLETTTLTTEIMEEVERTEETEVSEPSYSTSIENTTISVEAENLIEGVIQKDRVTETNDRTSLDSMSMTCDSSAEVNVALETELARSSDSFLTTTTVTSESLAAIGDSLEETKTLVNELANAYARSQALRFLESDWLSSFLSASETEETEQTQQHVQVTENDSSSSLETSSMTTEGSTTTWSTDDDYDEELESVVPMRQHPPSKSRKIAKMVVSTIIAMDWRSDDEETDEAASENVINIDYSEQPSTDKPYDLDPLIMAAFMGVLGHDYNAQLAENDLRESQESMEESSTE